MYVPLILQWYSHVSEVRGWYKPHSTAGKIDLLEHQGCLGTGPVLHPLPGMTGLGVGLCSGFRPVCVHPWVLFRLSGKHQFPIPTGLEFKAWGLTRPQSWLGEVWPHGSLGSYKGPVLGRVVIPWMEFIQRQSWLTDSGSTLTNTATEDYFGNVQDSTKILSVIMASSSTL